VDFKFSHVKSNRMTVGRLSYGADVEVRVEPLSTWYQVDLTLKGAVEIKQRGKSVTTAGRNSGAVLDPAYPFSVRYSPTAEQYAVMVSKTSLESQLAAMLGRPIEGPLRFDLDLDLSTVRGQSLLAAIRHLHIELTRLEGLADLSFIRAQLEAYVLTQLLLGTNHEFHEQLLDVKALGRAHVRKAVEFIDENARSPITVGDIARHVHVCERALQLGFREEMGVSPTTYLRNIRLRGAYDDIVSQDDSVLITEIAYRWGFQHLGRFAQTYRERFGLLPSDTPRASR
jgi:AraC-like DNA-binding protein